MTTEELLDEQRHLIEEQKLVIESLTRTIVALSEQLRAAEQQRIYNDTVAPPRYDRGAVQRENVDRTLLGEV